jgi:K+-sensing histidine kinase KdpD
VFQINTASFRMASLGVCLFAVAMTAWLFGRWPALIGSIAASLTLAIWVFPPAGSLAIQNRAELQALALFQIAAIATALMRSAESKRASTQ